MRIWGCIIAAALVTEGTAPRDKAAETTECVSSQDGLTLAPGYCATVFADTLGAVRHLTVNPSGTVFAILQAHRKGTPAGSIVQLDDDDQDGKADREHRFGSTFGLDIAWHRDWLFAASDDEIVRFRAIDGAIPAGAPAEIVVSGFPHFADGEHKRKTFAIDPDGRLFVLVGAPNNSCQMANRAPRSLGIDPCPYLEDAAGIWRYAANSVGQLHPQDGIRAARGVRNALGLAWNSRFQTLWVLQAGRDELSVAWPHLYSDGQAAEVPSEELLEIGNSPVDFGWPYCYHEPFLSLRLLAPEYGGDGYAIGRCAQYSRPLMTFPAHTSPSAIVIDEENRMRHRQAGAYVAFHGGWGRRPFPQQGYNVLFVAFLDGRVIGRWERFIEGFAGPSIVRMPEDARFRPAGLALWKSHLFVSDSKRGRIWRISRESE